MQCPSCTNVVLAITERQGIEIDYCPQCRGVWLDRGELDKILARNAVEAVSGPLPPRGHAGSARQDGHGGYKGSHGDNRHGSENGRRKRGFLSNLLDF